MINKASQNNEVYKPFAHSNWWECDADFQVFEWYKHPGEREVLFRVDQKNVTRINAMKMSQEKM